MRQLGINACIGTGFAGIFYDNARKNGLALPIVSSEVARHIDAISPVRNMVHEISIDIERRDDYSWRTDLAHSRWTMLRKLRMIQRQR